MDLFEYRAKHGAAEIERLTAAVGIRASYMDHLINWRKRPSTELAYKLIEESKGALTLPELLPPRSSLPELKAKNRQRLAESEKRAARDALEAAERATDPGEAVRLSRLAKRRARHAVTLVEKTKPATVAA